MRTVLSLWKGVMEKPIPHRRLSEVAFDVAKEHGLTIADLKGRSKKALITQARTQAYAECYETGRYSTPQIGAYFGRDHSTIVEMIKRHKNRASQPPDILCGRPVDSSIRPVDFCG